MTFSSPILCPANSSWLGFPNFAFCLHNSERPSCFAFLLHGSETAFFRQKTRVIAGLTAFVSFLSRIIILPCLLSQVRKQLPCVFVLFSSCLWWKGKSGPTYSIIANIIFIRNKISNELAYLTTFKYKKISGLRLKAIILPVICFVF